MNPVAKLTWSEYLSAINPSGKRHPSDAYSRIDTKTLQSYTSPEDFPESLYEVTRGGLSFTVKERKEDNYAKQYVKHDDNGDIIYQNGSAVMLTPEEIAATGKPRYSYEHAIVDNQTGKVVAHTSDEWGTLLLSVAKEYRGLGLGPLLKKEHTNRHPFRPSGGMTPGGENCAALAHAMIVEEAFVKGHYAEAIASGEMTQERVDEIEDSAEPSQIILDDREGTELNLAFGDHDNLIMHIHENVAVLYDKRLLEVMLPDSDGRYEGRDEFVEKGIVGYAYVGGVYEGPPKLFRLYSESESVKSMLAEVMLNQFVSQPVRLTQEQVDLLSSDARSALDLTEGRHAGMYTATLREPTLDWLDIAKQQEQKVRREMDNPYGEAWTVVLERATAVAEDSYDKEIEEPSVTLV